MYKISFLVGVSLVMTSMSSNAYTFTEILNLVDKREAVQGGNVTYWNFYDIAQSEGNNYILTTRNPPEAESIYYDMDLATRWSLEDTRDKLDMSIRFLSISKNSGHSLLTLNDAKDTVNQIEELTGEKLIGGIGDDVSQQSKELVDRLEARLSPIKERLRPIVAFRLIIDNFQNGKQGIGLLWGESCSTSVWDERIMKVNGQNITFIRECNKYSNSDETFYILYPKSEAGKSFVIQQFKQKNWVNINNVPSKLRQDIKLWANGFTKAWNAYGGDAL